MGSVASNQDSRKFVNVGWSNHDKKAPKREASKLDRDKRTLRSPSKNRSELKVTGSEGSRRLQLLECAKRTQKAKPRKAKREANQLNRDKRILRSPSKNRSELKGTEIDLVDCNVSNGQKEPRKPNQERQSEKQTNSIGTNGH